MRRGKEKQECREAQEVTHDLEMQEKKEVLQQSDRDQRRRWSKGNGIGSSTTTGKGESQQDPGQKAIRLWGEFTDYHLYPVSLQKWMNIMGWEKSGAGIWRRRNGKRTWHYYRISLSLG